MATRSQGVQPSVWRIAEHLPDALRFVQVLQLPAPILRSISSLEEPPAKVPPFASLNDALAALSPEIVAFHPLRAESRDERRWLYLRKGASLDCARLQTVIRVWLVACYGVQRAEALIKGWSERNWVWGELDLQQASPEMRRMLVPGLVVRWLLDQGYVFTLEENGRDVEMPLHLVLLMTQRNAAELITAPREAHGEHYSFVLRFWIASMPGSVCLHARTSMRRWVDRPFVENGKVYLKSGRGKSAYLRRSTGYLETQAAFGTYGPAQATVYARITLKHLGGDKTNLHWVGQQAKVFDLLSMHGALPPVDELATEPLKHFDQVLVVKDHHQARNQQVEPGLQPAVNPSTVQIWLNNLQPGDCPDSWATLVHELRRASSHMDIETLYPQPLHDAQTIEAYVERAVRDEREADDLNAIEGSEGAEL